MVEWSRSKAVEQLRGTLPRTAERRAVGLRLGCEMGESFGRCLCGKIEYTTSSVLAPVVNCHCGFCRRVHGAPFTTVAFLPASALSLLPSSAAPAQFATPAGNFRHFCAECSTPLYNTSGSSSAACLIVASLLEEHQPSPWFHVNTESRAPWFTVADELRQFASWPSPAEIRALARARSVEIPSALFAAET